MNKRIFALALALWLCLPLPVSAEPEAPIESQQTAHTGQADQSERNKRLYIILGGTVIGVTGMWMSLYRRGKRK